jgi:hypothetical protein
MPSGVVTVTFTRPGCNTVGAVAVRVLDDIMPKEAAGVDPKSTLLAPEKPAPDIVTTVPPAIGDDPGDSVDIEGLNGEVFW